MNLGLMLAAEGAPEASRVLAEALGTLNSLASQSPDELDIVDQLALCENNLASVVLDSDPGRAEQLLRSASGRYEKLTSLRPASPEHRSDQALTIGNLAAVVARRGDDQAAIELLGQVRRVRERLIELEPNVQTHVYDLAITYQQIGQIMVSSDQLADAATAYQASQSLLGDLIKQQPNDHRSVSSLGRVTGNLGMIEARRGNHGRAVALLRQAAEHQKLAIQLSPDNVRSQQLLEHHLDQLANVRSSDPTTQGDGIQ
jgi:tetratricopeptide (TPR) repeat protein